MCGWDVNTPYPPGVPRPAGCCWGAAAAPSRSRGPSYWSLPRRWGAGWTFPRSTANQTTHMQTISENTWQAHCTSPTTKIIDRWLNDRSTGGWTGQSVDWLTVDWLTHRSINWSDWLFGNDLINWSIDWLTDRPTDRPTEWLTDLTEGRIDRLINRMIGQMTDWMIDTLINCSID